MKLEELISADRIDELIYDGWDRADSGWSDIDKLLRAATREAAVAALKIADGIADNIANACVTEHERGTSLYIRDKIRQIQIED